MASDCISIELNHYSLPSPQVFLGKDSDVQHVLCTDNRLELVNFDPDRRTKFVKMTEAFSLISEYTAEGLRPII